MMAGVPTSLPPRSVIGFAHRGARAHAPENTIEAFVTACRMGARGLETDVWLSRDGQAIIDHDGVVATPGGRRGIATFDADDLPAHIPTLADLQDAVGFDVELSIDVKDPAAIDAIIDVRARGGTAALARTWLCDPQPERLTAWRNLDPDVRLVASLRPRDLIGIELADLAAMGISTLNLRQWYWSHSLVERCHRTGLGAFAWGVQSRRRMRRLVRWGVDAVYSDHTDRMTRVLQPADATDRPDLHERPTHER